MAEEGINGTVSGTRQAIDELKSWFENDSRFHALEYKESMSEKCPFYRLKIKLNEDKSNSMAYQNSEQKRYRFTS